MDSLKDYSSKLEDIIDRIGQPIKPHIPAIARFLIVVTFLEDAIRISTQFGDQLYYLQRHRGFPWGLSHLFLIVNVLTMLSCSTLVIARKHTEYAAAALLGVVVTQALGYGLIFDASFFLRNLSVIGGLLMVVSDSIDKRRQLFAGLPSVTESNKRTYFQLAGRVLLIFLFVGFILHGSWSLTRFIGAIIGFGACVMVAVGFKAKWSAMFLVLFLSVFNIVVNNWWSVENSSAHKDFLKYDFFQTLSIMGGLLLLVTLGPGGMSMDEKKKAF
ncbi:MAG: SURF4 family-domain-containing protein [Linnemannia gamsii]|nr:MAG: SURF4 family-domain-containing protein [Linnemannia gamsii]